MQTKDGFRDAIGPLAITLRWCRTEGVQDGADCRHLLVECGELCLYLLGQGCKRRAERLHQCRLATHPHDQACQIPGCLSTLRQILLTLQVGGPFLQRFLYMFEQGRGFLRLLTRGIRGRLVYSQLFGKRPQIVQRLLKAFLGIPGPQAFLLSRLGALTVKGRP